MSIGKNTPRAREIAEKRREIAELLRADQFRSNRAIAGAVGCGHPLVAKVRAALTDDEGMIVGAPRWRRPELPRTAVEVRAVQDRDIDELVVEVSRLMGERDDLTRRLSECRG